MKENNCSSYFTVCGGNHTSSDHTIKTILTVLLVSDSASHFFRILRNKDSK